MIEKDCKVTGGTIVCSNIHIKEGVSIPEGSICSTFKYDEEAEDFIESKETNKEFFKKGNISYLPLNLRLKDSELIGASLQQNDDVLSELSFNDDESDGDPFLEFKKEMQDLFQTCIN